MSSEKQADAKRANLTKYASEADGSGFYTENGIFAILHDNRQELGDVSYHIVNTPDPERGIEPYILGPNTTVAERNTESLSKHLTKRFQGPGTPPAEAFIINKNNNHWATLIVQKDQQDPRKVHYTYIDSLSDTGNPRQALDWLTDELSKVKVNGQPVVLASRKLNYQRQQNDIDDINCGDHVALNVLSAAPIIKEGGDFFSDANIKRFEGSLAADQLEHGQTEIRRASFIKAGGVFDNYEQHLEANYRQALPREEERREAGVAEGEILKFRLAEACNRTKYLVSNHQIDKDFKIKLGELYDGTDYLRENAGGQANAARHSAHRKKFINEFVQFYHDPNKSPFTNVTVGNREHFVGQIETLLTKFVAEVRQQRNQPDPEVEMAPVRRPALGQRLAGRGLTIDTALGHSADASVSSGSPDSSNSESSTPKESAAQALQDTSSSQDTPDTPATPGSPRRSGFDSITQPPSVRKAFEEATKAADEARKDYESARKAEGATKLKIEEELAKMQDDARKHRFANTTPSDPLVAKLVDEQDAQTAYNRRKQQPDTPYVGIGADAEWVGEGRKGFKISANPQQGTPAAILGLQKGDLIVSAMEKEGIMVGAEEKAFGQALLKVIHGREGRELKSLIVLRANARGVLEEVDLVKQAKDQAEAMGQPIDLTRKLISPKSLTVFQGYQKEFKLTHEKAYEDIRLLAAQDPEVAEGEERKEILRAKVFAAVYKSDGEKDYSFDKLDKPLQDIVKELKKVLNTNSQQTKDNAVKEVVRDIRKPVKIDVLNNSAKQEALNHRARITPGAQRSEGRPPDSPVRGG